jgi:5-formyltetrahydrofolate cyclo-ligase
MPKRSLRRELLTRRKAMTAGERDAAAGMIQRALVGSATFARARVIALYAPINNEVATDEVFRAAREQGKVVLYPAVDGDTLVFRSVAEAADLARGAFGIPEPTSGCPLRNPEDADLIIVPAVAFARDGQRIGYGKGYYDRTLHRLEGSGRLVGFCYEFQLVDAIIGEPHDVRMDIIITEGQVLFPRN